MSRVDKATSLFQEGFNCTQSMLAVFGGHLGIEYNIALKISSAFGGGIAGTGETCGAVTGALMSIGLKYGAVNAKGNDAMDKTYMTACEFMKMFRSRNNSISRSKLLGFKIG